MAVSHPHRHPGSAPPIRHDPQWRIAAGATGLVGIAQLAGYAVQLTREPLFAATWLACDDTYYYLQTAWNLVHVGTVSFDGQNATNGVQFLWFWVTALLASVAASKASLLGATLWLCAGLNVACLLPIWLIGRQLGRPLLVVFMAAFWCCATLLHFVSGMENSLSALVFWSVVWQLIRTVDGLRRAALTRHDLLVPFGCLSLLVWTRVDQALFAVVGAASLTVAAVYWHGWTRTTRNALGRGAAIAAIAAIVMFVGFYAMGDTPLPISGRIKMDTYAWSWPYAAELLTRGFDRVLSPLIVIERLVPTGWQTAVKWGAVVPLIALFTLVLRWRGYQRCLGGYGGPLVIGALAVTTLVHTLFLAGLREYAIYGTWYFTPLLVTLAIVSAVTVDGVLHWLGRRPIVRGAIALTLLAGVGWCGWTRYQWFDAGSRHYRESLQYRRIEVARWLKDNLPPDTRIAAWNAGALGYFSDLPLTNLDGLVNSAAYYEDVLRGDETIPGYLAAQGFEFVIDYDIKPDVRAATRSVRVFEVPRDREGRRLELVRLPAQDRALTRGSDTPAR